jgi:hypothetical protein
MNSKPLQQLGEAEAVASVVNARIGGAPVREAYLVLTSSEFHKSVLT